MKYDTTRSGHSIKLVRPVLRALAWVILCALLLIGATISIGATTTSEPNATTPVRYGYTTASGNVRYVYEQLVAGVMREMPLETISLEESRSVTLDEVASAVSLFLSDYPECFWMRNAYNYSHRDGAVLKILPSYSFTGTALIVARAEVNAAVDEILSEMPRLTAWDTALYLHDAIAARVEYVQVGEHQTAYGALVSGKAVCAGYAAAYHLLLREAGIAAWTVTGSSNDPATGEPIPHAWNVVWLDGETCVWTDVTWDDQGKNLYHAYFQLSLEEISLDHELDDEIFSVPACNHDDQSYFDKKYAVLNRASTVNEAARLFGKVEDGKRSASFIFEGDGLEAWLQQNLDQIYRELGGRSTCHASYTVLGKEVQVTLEGSYVSENYTFSLTAAPHITVEGYPTQEVTEGGRIQTITLTADEGYYFPSDYYPFEEQPNGITVMRFDAKTLKVTGYPTCDVEMTMPAPAQQTPQAVPNAVFTVTGADCGVLSEVSAGMAYSTDGGSTWTPIDGSDPITVTGLRPCTLSVITRGNGEEIGDSPRQQINVIGHATPSLTVVQPTAACETGAILSDVTHEYRTENGEWTDCGGALEALATGTYYVRIKATDTALASDAQTVVILPYAEEESNTEESSNTDMTAAESTNEDIEETERSESTGGTGGAVGLAFGCASALSVGSLPLALLLGAAVCALKKSKR